MLLRDGTMYFVVLFAINISQVVLTIVALFPITDIFGVLSPILVSRFLLNLRQLGEPQNETQSHFNSRFSIPGFRVPTLESVIGNMGADLDHGPAEEAIMDGGDAEVEVLDAIAEDGSGVLVEESVHEFQAEVPLQMA
ncbi:hypothetical protein EW026_g6748 [Hermanssonia centrifuga]|uniref:Uncharacterized protein n=1 Tax=Hermanssonia centrifuga TaxID=98765 RepID=A0A4S4KA04_9APHY|nr:hypothetical protein EW026_g6748 [Hermanssonia centrifuga]